MSLNTPPPMDSRTFTPPQVYFEGYNPFTPYYDTLPQSSAPSYPQTGQASGGIASNPQSTSKAPSYPQTGQASGGIASNPQSTSKAPSYPQTGQASGGIAYNPQSSSNAPSYQQTGQASGGIAYNSQSSSNAPSYQQTGQASGGIAYNSQSSSNAPSYQQTGQAWGGIAYNPQHSANVPSYQQTGQTSNGVTYNPNHQSVTNFYATTQGNGFNLQADTRVSNQQMDSSAFDTYSQGIGSNLQAGTYAQNYYNPHWGRHIPAQSTRTSLSDQNQALNSKTCQASCGYNVSNTVSGGVADYQRPNNVFNDTTNQERAPKSNEEELLYIAALNANEPDENLETAEAKPRAAKRKIELENDARAKYIKAQSLVNDEEARDAIMKFASAEVPKKITVDNLYSCAWCAEDHPGRQINHHVEWHFWGNTKSGLNEWSKSAKALKKLSDEDLLDIKAHMGGNRKRKQTRGQRIR